MERATPDAKPSASCATWKSVLTMVRCDWVTPNSRPRAANTAVLPEPLLPTNAVTASLNSIVTGSGLKQRKFEIVNCSIFIGPTVSQPGSG